MAIDPDDVDAVILAQMAEPESATVDGNSVKNRNTKELKGLYDVAAQGANGSVWGRRMGRVVFPSASAE